MKHTVELKLPKLFGKKKQVEEPVAEPKEETFKMEKEQIIEYSKKAAPFVATLAVGYVAGVHKGMSKGQTVVNIIQGK